MIFSSGCVCFCEEKKTNNNLLNRTHLVHLWNQRKTIVKEHQYHHHLVERPPREDSRNRKSTLSMKLKLKIIPRRGKGYNVTNEEVTIVRTIFLKTLIKNYIFTMSAFVFLLRCCDFRSIILWCDVISSKHNVSRSSNDKCVWLVFLV